MKRSQHSIHYDTSTEPYLQYAGPADMLDYADAASLTDQLPMDELVLLKHMQCFVRFVEDLRDAVYERLERRDQATAGQSALTLAIMEEQRRLQRLERQKRQLLTTNSDDDDDEDEAQHAVDRIHIPDLLGVAWFWHKLVRERKREMTGHYAHTLFLSWTGYCKLFHLWVVSDVERYDALKEKTADQFPYCEFASDEANVVVSNAPLMAYTVTEIWAAARRIAPLLYKHTYHVEMKHYFHALFFRYCDLFCSQHQSGELARLMDNPLFCDVVPYRPPRPQRPALPCVMDVEQQQQLTTMMDDDDDDDGEEVEDIDWDHYDAYRHVSVRLDQQYVLKSEYFYEGELLFFFQLMRIELSRQLQERQSGDPLILKRKLDEPLLKKCNTAVMKMFSEISVNTYLKKDVVEDYKRTVLSLYLFHGEKERYVRRNPIADNNPSVVLKTCRNNDHEAAINMQKMTLGSVIDGQYEREIVLIAKHATTRWVQFKGVPQRKAIAQAFCIEELMSVEELEALVTKNDVRQTTVPVLLKLVHVYYVLYKGSVYQSVIFVESYMVWLALLVYKAKLVKLGLVHPTIKKELQYFVSI